MNTREWKRIERLASIEAFQAWISALPAMKHWPRGDTCACPLHDFIRQITGHEISVNSPEISEPWHERETQTWPTPLWMRWLIRSIDQTGDGRITAKELRVVFTIGVAREWECPLDRPEESEALRLLVVKG
jgi:hypothetical protein